MKCFSIADPHQEHSCCRKKTRNRESLNRVEWSSATQIQHEMKNETNLFSLLRAVVFFSIEVFCSSLDFGDLLNWSNKRSLSEHSNCHADTMALHLLSFANLISSRGWILCCKYSYIKAGNNKFYFIIFIVEAEFTRWNHWGSEQNSVHAYHTRVTLIIAALWNHVRENSNFIR